MHSNFADTLEDFANSPYKVGSWYKYTEVKENLIPNPNVIKIGQKYESYAENVEGAYSKLGSGTYSLLESRDSLIFLIRNRFTNKYARICSSHGGTIMASKLLHRS